MLKTALVTGLLSMAMALACFAEKVTDSFDASRDWYSMPADFRPRDFHSLSRLFIEPGDSLWKAENYGVTELEQVSRHGEAWVRWRFSRKADGFIPNLAYRPLARVEPLGFSLRVFNHGADAAQLSGWDQTDTKTWVTVAPGEDRVVRLAGRSTLVVQGTKLDTEYDLWLRELVVHYPEAEGLEVAALDVPPNISAGQEMKARIQLLGPPAERRLYLEARLDPYVVWRICLSDEECAQLEAAGECFVEREVPRYLSPNELSFGLAADGLRCAGTEGRVLVVNELEPGFPRLERRKHNGRPTFFLNGQPFAWSGYATYFNISPAVFQEFADAGANLFHAVAAPGRHFHSVSAPTWLGSDGYDFGELEQWVATILQADPEAKIVIRLALGLPPFWFAEHPDSRVRIRTVEGREVVWHETGSMVASLTSVPWREQQAAVLRRLIQYIASRPWASQVVGFNLGGGMTEEWFAWASCEDIVTPVKCFSDYSPANQRAFQDWCAVRGYPYAEIPGPEARTRTSHDLFPDDTNGCWAAAYNLFINETTADTLLYFARVVKEETRNKSLLGAFFGYVVLLAGEARQSVAGQFGLRQVLDSEDIDFVSGVPLFAFRHLTGTGYAGQPTAVESVLAHGKQYVDDNDLFSWLHDKHWFTEYDERDPRGAAIKMHRRWMGNEAVHGSSAEWFSLSPQWHHDARLMAEYGKEAEILKTAVNMDRSPLEEVAFVVDDHSFAWVTPSAQTHYSVQFLLGALARTGAPVGVWLLSDLDRLPDRIKFVAVVNAHAPRTEDLNSLKRLIKLGGRTIMVVGTPGLVDEGTQHWKPENMEALLGMPIRLDTAPATGRARLADGQWLCTMETPMQAHLKDPTKVQPRAHSTGEGFLTYADGKTAGVERPLANGGRLLWCGVPPYASETWLRAQVQEAGVHCYAPVPCSVHASEELVSITSVYADDQDIELDWPETVEVVDVIDGWRGQGKVMTCPFEYGQTRLFRVTKR